jgi:hypothetical protein
MMWLQYASSLHLALRVCLEKAQPARAGFIIPFLFATLGASD